MTVNVGPSSHAVRRFLTRMAELGMAPTSTLTLLWSVDRQNRTTVISEAAGWMLKGAATYSDKPANVFISTDGESYVVGRDKDPSVGRILPHKLGRATEYKRLPDERWRPALLALYAFELSGRLSATSRPIGRRGRGSRPDRRPGWTSKWRCTVPRALPVSPM